MNFKKTIPSWLILYWAALGLSEAQTEFSGAFAQAGVGYGVINRNGTQNVLAAGHSTVLRTGTMGDIAAFSGTLGVSYYWDLGSKWLLGLGLDFSPGTSSSAAFTLKATNGQASTSGTTQFNNGLILYLSPGYALSPDQFVYAKLGYARSNSTTSTALLSKSNDLDGYSLGLGYKQAFSDHFYGFVEWRYVRFNTLTSASSIQYANANLIVNASAQPSSNNILLGIGYRF